MKATCQLCQWPVTAPERAATMGIDPESERGRLIDMDGLSEVMWLHISDYHPNQTSEGIIHQVRAAKLYAMRWAKIEPQHEETSKALRAQLVIGLSVVSEFAGDRQDGADSNSSDAGSSGSAKNSSRKREIC